MKTVIVSGYFNPVHIGHIRMLQAAYKLGDSVIAIVNNDTQQLQKKGKIIMNEDERLEIVKAIKYVDVAILAVDKDRTVCQTLLLLSQHDTIRNTEIIFANGGDRDDSKKVPEADICERAGIKMVFDCGGTEKLNSSTNINRLTGEEKENEGNNLSGRTDLS
jgi:cytidyltransferase-like protein